MKNTFIHFGSPDSRTPAGLATPKTVPPHFAPHEADAGAAMSSAPIAPLRLFDFLPSPQVTNKGTAGPVPSAGPLGSSGPPGASSAQLPLQAETITAMAAFHAVHAIFSAMPQAPTAMPPLPQLGGYQAQPQQYMWPAETSQPDMSGQMPGTMQEMQVMPDGSGGFDDWSAWNWNQGEPDSYLGMAQQDSWDLERYDEV